MTGLLHVRSFDCICGEEQNDHLDPLRKRWKRQRSIADGERGLWQQISLGEEGDIRVIPSFKPGKESHCYEGP